MQPECGQVCPATERHRRGDAFHRFRILDVGAWIRFFDWSLTTFLLQISLCTAALATGGNRHLQRRSRLLQPGMKHRVLRYLSGLQSFLERSHKKGINFRTSSVSLASICSMLVPQTVGSAEQKKAKVALVCITVTHRLHISATHFCTGSMRKYKSLLTLCHLTQSSKSAAE